MSLYAFVKVFKGLFVKFQARLNVAKYAKKPSVSKALFEYILYHENSVREAMDLAAQVRDRLTDRLAKH